MGIIYSYNRDHQIRCIPNISCYYHPSFQAYPIEVLQDDLVELSSIFDQLDERFVGVVPFREFLQVADQEYTNRTGLCTDKTKQYVRDCIRDAFTRRMGHIYYRGLCTDKSKR